MSLKQKGCVVAARHTDLADKTSSKRYDSNKRPGGQEHTVEARVRERYTVQ